MDNITHSITGYALGKAGLNPRPGWDLSLYVILVSNLPDIDFLYAQLQSGPQFLYRRQGTHGLVGVPLLALLVTFLAARFMPGVSRARLFVIALVAMIVHVALDAANAYGTAFLSPFSDHRFAACWLFIIDPLLWLCCLLPPLVTRLVRRSAARPAWRFAVLCAALYVFGCGWLHHRAVVITRTGTAAGDRVWALSEPLSPQYWRGISRQGDTYTIELVDAARGRRRPLATVRTDDADSLVIRLRRSPAGRDLDWFFLIPVWRRDAGSIAAFDLKFGSALAPHLRPIMPYLFPIEDPETLDRARFD